MHTPRVLTTVRRDWLTESYVVEWAVELDTGERLCEGSETYGPLWDVDQVERLVAGHTASLMATWLRR